MAGFGDIRVAERAEWFLRRIVMTGSLAPRRLGAGRAGEMSAHRLLSSPHASVEAVIDRVSARTGEACAGLEIVCAQDTSEINFSGRAAARSGLGPGGDGATPGFFVHPLVAVDAAEGRVLGLAGAEIWTRGANKASPRLARAPQERESHRWLAGAERAGAVLAKAARITVVGDRESDIYRLFALRPANVELIVRAAQDRALNGGGHLFAALAAGEVLAVKDVSIPPRPGVPGRTAAVSLRARRVEIKRPAAAASAGPGLPESLWITLVEAREDSPPEGMKPLVWRLLSSAERPPGEIVRLYRQRWRIEEVFRTLKSGLGLPETQLQDASRIFMLAAFALAASVRIIQLVDARDGSQRPASDAVDPGFAPALAAISKSLEGASARQKNPFPPDRLSFVAWICARLGGWNCYYKPPGPKTMAAGWNALAQQLAGYALATGLKNV